MASEDPLRVIYYHGEVVNGNPEGFGTMKYSDGSEFTGMFLDDAPEGLGVLNGIGDGTMFVGNVSGHRPHGFGVFFHRKNELGHQPLTLGNFVHGVPDGSKSLFQTSTVLREKTLQNLLMVLRSEGCSLTLTCSMTLTPLEALES